MAACGGGESSSSAGPVTTRSTTLTIYSSLPLQGAARQQSQSIVDAERMALEEAGGKVGRFKVEFVSLDDATAPAGQWDPGQTSSNARRAAKDITTIAYIGDLDSAATAISLPILNEAGILQVSPASTAVGLTRSEGADQAEPERYYPTGRRTFGRVVPADNVQAAAQVMYQKDEGCSKTYVVNDRGVYGKGIASQVQLAAKPAGLTIVRNEDVDMRASNFRGLAQRIAASGADCMFFGGGTEQNAVRLFTDVNAAGPTLKLFGPDGVATSAFASRLNGATQKATYVTDPALDPRLYPPAGQEFFARFRQKYGRDPQPFAIYGYEAMKLVLQAIKSAGDAGNDRPAVVDAFFRTQDRESVLGKYSIDKNGDTTLADYGADRIEHGRLMFVKVLEAKAAGS